MLTIVVLAVAVALLLDPFSLLGFMALLVVVLAYVNFVLSREFPFWLRILSVCVALLVPILGLPFVLLAKRIRNGRALKGDI